MKQKRWGDNNEQNDFARVHTLSHKPLLWFTVIHRFWEWNKGSFSNGRQPQGTTQGEEGRQMIEKNVSLLRWTIVYSCVSYEHERVVTTERSYHWQRSSNHLYDYFHQGDLVVCPATIDLNWKEDNYICKTKMVQSHCWTDLGKSKVWLICVFGGPYE